MNHANLQNFNTKKSYVLNTFLTQFKKVSLKATLVINQAWNITFYNYFSQCLLMMNLRTNIFINRHWVFFDILLTQNAGMLHKIYTFQASKVIFVQNLSAKNPFFPTHLQRSQKCLLVGSRALGQVMEPLSWGAPSTARQYPAYGAHLHLEDCSKIAAIDMDLKFRIEISCEL